MQNEYLNDSLIEQSQDISDDSQLIHKEEDMTLNQLPNNLAAFY